MEYGARRDVAIPPDWVANRQVVGDEKAGAGPRAWSGLPATGERQCRICGCWDRRACYQPHFGACSWVEADLCSHCVPRLKARRWRRRFFLLLLGIAAFWTLCAAVAWRDVHLAPDAPPPAPGAAQGV